MKLSDRGIIEELIYRQMERINNLTDKRIFRVFYWLLSILILSAVALYNRFPLFYSDSGTYLLSSVNLLPPVDRPIGYGLFIRLVSWQATSWMVIVFQNIIVSFIIFEVIKTALKPKNIYIVHFGIIVILTVASSLSWFSCQVMPDIFISCLVLVIYLFMFSEKLGFLRSFIYILLIIFFIISHLSHILFFFALLFSLLIYEFLIRKTAQYSFLVVKKSFLLIITGIISTVFLMTYNGLHGCGFVLSRATNVMFVAKFDNSGLLKTYLDDNCPNLHNCELCQYKDSLPLTSDDFLWGSRSPLYHYKEPGKIDRWLVANFEYDNVVKDILSSPKYYPSLIFETVKSGCVQLFTFKIGDGIIPLTENSAPYYVFRDDFGNELSDYRCSYQNSGLLKFETVNELNIIMLAISLMLIFYCFVKYDLSYKLRFLIIFVFISIIYNAFITSGLSVIADRYGARMTWLITFLGLICLIEIRRKISCRTIADE